MKQKGKRRLKNKTNMDPLNEASHNDGLTMCCLKTRENHLEDVCVVVQV